jgi:ubiquinone/menaquinone biosynthesis C-methylase UbiE
VENRNEHARLNEEKWDKRAKTFDDRCFNYFRFMQKRLISLLDLRENQRLLDLGCGTGWAVRYAASLVHERGEFYGIDISSKMIERAKENSSDFKNVNFYQANAEELPFGDEFFDFIICSNSFHHYFSPDKVLSEAHRILKSKGRIYILDVSSDCLVVRIADKWLGKRDPSHVKLYNTREYKALFAQAKLNYVTNKSIRGLLFVKIHIGEKQW